VGLCHLEGGGSVLPLTRRIRWTCAHMWRTVPWVVLLTQRHLKELLGGIGRACGLDLTDANPPWNPGSRRRIWIECHGS